MPIRAEQVRMGDHYVVHDADDPAETLDGERLARAYMDALNDRDPEPLLELLDPSVEFVPTSLSRNRRKYKGHAGVRDWLKTAADRGNRYTGSVTEVRSVGADRWAILGQVRLDGRVVAPLAVMIRVRNGLILESRSYLSDASLLHELGHLSPEA